MADDVVVTIGASADSLISEVRRARKSVAEMERSARSLADEFDDTNIASSRAAKGVKGLGDKSETSSRKVSKLKSEAERFNRTGQVLGGRLGELGGKFDAFASLVDMTGSKLGAVGLVAGGALVAGLAAAGGAVVGLGAHMVDTARNVEELEKRLDVFTREQLSESIVQVYAVRDAFEAMDGQIAATSLSLTGTFSDALIGTADTMAGFAYAATLVSESIGLDGIGESAQIGGLALLRYLNPGLASTVELLGDVREVGRKLREERTFVGPLQSMGGSAGGAAGAASARTSGAQAQAAGPRTFGGLLLPIGTFTSPGRDLSDALGSQAVISEAQTLGVALEEVAEDTDMAWSDALGNISNTLGDLAQQLVATFEDTSRIAELETAIQSDAFKRMSREKQQALRKQLQEERRAAMDRWAASQGIALAQAAVNAALTITQSFAQLGPIAGAVAAVAAGATVAAQIATIATTKPKFHIGGLAPDEYMSGGAVYRSNERNVTLTRQGVEALGGAPGIGQVNATGEVPMRPIYLIVDGQPRAARAFAGPKPGYGRRERRR